MSRPELEDFYSAIQKECLPGIWSRGVALARSKSVRLERQTPEEITLRVKAPEKTVSPKVSLWPGDEDAFCDCGDRVEPCIHIAAAVAALKNGWEVTEESAPSNTVIRYQLRRSGSVLTLERSLGDEVVRESLVGIIGGIGSGRIVRAKIDATQTDFAIDQAMQGHYDGKLDRAAWLRILPHLRSVSETQPGGLNLDQTPITVGTPFRGVHAEVTSEKNGLRLVLVEDPSVTERFEQGVVLCSGTLRVLEEGALRAQERQALLPPGRFYPPSETPHLLTQVIPALEARLEVRMLAERIPEVKREPPRIVLRLETSSDPAGDQVLNVVASIEYSSEYVVKDPEAERELARRLQTEWHLVPGGRAKYRGTPAVEFVRKVQGAPGVEARGGGVKTFSVDDPLSAELTTTGEDFQLRFQTSQGKIADSDRVLDAWSRGESYVPLMGGGFSPLPSDWLSRFGPQLQRLLALRGLSGGKIPAYARPEILSLSEETGANLAPGLRSLKEKLEHSETLPDAPLPQDLRADLRHYQRTGVNWLSFLNQSGMGALLADDMGLGKTLQAICVIHGRTLVVAPTSVLYGWREQLQRFRPGLTISFFHGPSRRMDPAADVVLTSYGLLRMDQELLQKEEWDLAILDEAQLIKNPESQVAQAAHRLRAKSRMTLSGTPVENRLDDLWSQFQFLNPGLLGTRREFQEEFAAPVARGDSRAVERLQKRIRPFLLRRLKRDVAPELPSRTEVVLHSELSPEEKELYQAMLVTARKEVIEKLEEGASVFSVLEQLLRLRQACCHPGLLPGQSAETSAKLELLAETLERSIAQGHRALIFSQWTSFLDLIEPRLEKMGISWSRLDGSTRNREEVVQDFQRPDGPRVMLLSLKAGGVGLTLTAADHVYLMDSWWNPAVEDQAADRVHRIGQENPVLITRLIAKDTVEERILELQKRKLALSEAALGRGNEASAGAGTVGTGAPGSISRDDILALLSE